MKRILLIYLLISSSCFTQMKKSNVGEPCKINEDEIINLDILDTFLLGNWDYTYSYINDTCFVIEELGDLPIDFLFYRSDLEKVKRQYPKLYSFGEGKMLFGLECSNSGRLFNKTNYPIVNVVADDASWLKITHYQQGNGVGKMFSYYLQSNIKDILVIKNQRQYTINGKKIYGVQHVYKRK